MGKMRGTVKFPTGLEYFPDFFSKSEEKKLLDFITSLEFHELKQKED